MNNIQFHTGGFPFEIPTIEFLQEQTKLVSNLAALGGTDTYILSGVATEGANVTDGYIVYKGEILAFKGGEKQVKVTIIEEVETVIYKADDNGDGKGDEKMAYTRRMAKFGTDGVDTFDFSLLKPFIEGIGGEIFKTFFKDVRLPYIGAIEDIPKGWELCEVLSGYFPVIYDPNNPDYNEIGKEGGANEVTLTEGQMPIHKHNGSTNQSGAHAHSGNTASSGSHKHTGSTVAAGRHTHYGNTGNSGSHRHGMVDGAGGDDGSGRIAAGNSHGTQSLANAFTKYSGTHSHYLNISWGGEHSHELSMSEEGAHSHSFDTNQGGAHTHTVNTENKGGNQPHENRPLHKVIALIKWVGF